MTQNQISNIRADQKFGQSARFKEKSEVNEEFDAKGCGGDYRYRETGP